MSEAASEPMVGPRLRADWRAWLLALVAVAGVAVAVALVVTLGNASTARDEALRSQSRSYEVMIQAQALSGYIARAEATLGRYVISGDKALGQEYYSQWVRAGAQLDGLDRYARDNAVQQRQIAAIRRAYEARGKELAQVALYSSYRRNMAALRHYYDVRETRSLAALDAALDQVISGERAVLAQRIQAARASVEQTNLATRMLVGFGLLILVCAMLLGWLVMQAIKQRAVADADALAQRERTAELERAVEAATADLKQEAREREAAEAQLRQAQKMEAVGQLTGGIAHDFNNMLAVVLGGLELARRRIHEGGKDAQRHIENAMEGANRAAALTRRLLAFSRSEPVLPEAVDAAALVEGMRDLLDRTLGGGLSIETADDGSGWCVWVDRYQLENAVLNLAVNARDAMEGRGTIRIATGSTTLAQNQVGESPAGDYATIAVSDTGCGMTPEVIERVFEPFFTTKPVGKGTGLGLSQIFGFVRQSGGEIAIDSAPGEGTTVTLFLPRHTASAAAPASAEAVHLEPRAPGEALDILVVEDDPRVLAATVAALAELGHRPVACGDPTDAPALVEKLEALDLIVSDVLMPGQSGPEMIATLAPKLGNAAVLFVTGYAGEGHEQDRFGGYPVLRKPFTMAALSRAVDEAMAGRHDGAPPRRAVNG